MCAGNGISLTVRGESLLNYNSVITGRIIGFLSVFV
jgi:hypothetical protein